MSQFKEIAEERWPVHNAHPGPHCYEPFVPNPLSKCKITNYEYCASYFVSTTLLRVLKTIIVSPVIAGNPSVTFENFYKNDLELHFANRGWPFVNMALPGTFISHENNNKEKEKERTRVFLVLMLPACSL